MKCDESRPSCYNCRRYKAICSLSSILPTRGEATALRGQALDRQSSQSALAESPSIATEAAPEKSLAPNLWAGSRFKNETSALRYDAELMHHFCTATAHSLAMGSDTREMWSSITPRVGYEHHFIMHGVLAISSLHKAYVTPSQSDLYLDLAAYHQVAGSEGFRTALMSVTTENWRSVFCFANIQSLYLLCTPMRCPQDVLEDPVARFLDTARGIAGVRTATSGFLTLVPGSDFSPVMRGIKEAAEQTMKGYVLFFVSSG